MQNEPKKKKGPILAVHSLDGSPFPPAEVPDGFPKALWRCSKVLLHGLTELLTYPLLCLYHSCSCCPLGPLLPQNCLRSPPMSTMVSEGCHPLKIYIFCLLFMHIHNISRCCLTASQCQSGEKLHPEHWVEHGVMYWQTTSIYCLYCLWWNNN